MPDLSVFRILEYAVLRAASVYRVYDRQAKGFGSRPAVALGRDLGMVVFALASFQMIPVISFLRKKTMLPFCGESLLRVFFVRREGFGEKVMIGTFLVHAEK